MDNTDVAQALVRLARGLSGGNLGFVTKRSFEWVGSGDLDLNVHFVFRPKYRMELKDFAIEGKDLTQYLEGFIGKKLAGVSGFNSYGTEIKHLKGADWVATLFVQFDDLDNDDRAEVEHIVGKIV